MNVRIVRHLAAGLVVLSSVVAGDFASAQLFRPRVRYSQPAVQPTEPAPADQAAPQPGQPAQPGQGGNVENGQLRALDPAKIVRGSQLVGQTILDPRSQKLGVIKDILVDSQTARVVYLLMAQEGSEANAEWIVIPFDLLRLSANSQASQPIFILNFEAAQLRAAPICGATHGRRYATRGSLAKCSSSIGPRNGPREGLTAT